MTKKPQMHPGLKLALDVGPLILFFAANARFGIYAATATFMVAVVVALAVSYALTRHWPIMPIVTAIVVLVFGGLTLALHDELFIKLKPTIIYLLFASLLLGGLAFRKPLLGMVFDSVFNLTEEGWRKLTVRWALFFFVLAVLNEIVWRTQTTDFWVSFKLFGVVPLTLLFGALQIRLLTKYEIKEEAAPVVENQRRGSN
jgi:intracellular septation protein